MLDVFSRAVKSVVRNGAQPFHSRYACLSVCVSFRRPVKNMLSLQMLAITVSYINCNFIKQTPVRELHEFMFLKRKLLVFVIFLMSSHEMISSGIYFRGWDHINHNIACMTAEDAAFRDHGVIYLHCVVPAVHL